MAAVGLARPNPQIFDEVASNKNIPSLATVYTGPGNCSTDSSHFSVPFGDFGPGCTSFLTKAGGNH
ncbi:hypothetical protein MauCBS54593_007754, partial [Microsporum audouinii]